MHYGRRMRTSPIAPGSPGYALAWGVGALATLAAFYAWSYGDAVGHFFHLDDFWVLKLGASVRSLADIPLVFRPTHGFFFYRPVSTSGYFTALHALFGTDPAGFHAVHLGFHVVNAWLAYAIGSRLFQARGLGLGTALVYAAAPGHVLAAYWIALFTVTGTAFFYYLGLWAWLALGGRWRVPVTFALFVIALLASEHAVSFPPAITAASLLLEPGADRRRLVRALAPFYVLLVAYLAGKAYAIGYLAAAAPPPDVGKAFVWLNYRMSLAPGSVLELLGRYLAFGLAPLYAPERPAALALALGAGVAALTLGAAIAVARGWWTARPLRVATFGLVLFCLALGPVVVLPAHLYSCYVGLAMLGLALAVVGLAAAVPRVPAVAVVAVVAIVLAAHGRVTLPQVRHSAELRYVASFSDRAARWLYALASAPGIDAAEEVVVPADQVTNMLFDLGAAERVFLCARYRVRATQAIGQERPAPGRVLVPGPVAALPPSCADYACVRRDCRAD